LLFLDQEKSPNQASNMTKSLLMKSFGFVPAYKATHCTEISGLTTVRQF
jgi:hypothetical protein